MDSDSAIPQHSFLKQVNNDCLELRRKETDAICLDLSKAFDRVLHAELLVKVRVMGLNVKIVK